MDDLDHSMHISDHDWLRFFEESEKCCLLHASLACPDSSGLSDADDPDFTTQTCAPIKEHQSGEDSKEPGFVEEEGSIVQCSSDVDGKGGSGPKSEHEPVMKNALDGDSLNPAEKERWFVSVNGKQPAQQLVPATVPVVKKKRKQKKICKMDCTHKDKANSIKKGKLPEQKCSNTRLETNVNTTYIESSRKSDSLDHLDKENNSESINVKSDSNEDRSFDTTSTQEICCESANIQLNTGLICIGVSCKESTFALQKTSDPNEIKSDTCNESTKYSKTLDSVFIHEKDRDVSSESSQTKRTMDLTCLQDSSTDDLEIKMERTCLIYSSSQGKLHNMVKENTKTGTFNDLDTINQARSCSSGAIQEECSKIKSWTCFGASCKEDSLDLTSGNTDEPEVDCDKPIDNPVTYHTNSIESDDFADYETFSSSSYDSETYHSAVEDPGHLSLQNSPCNLSACDNGDTLTDRRMQFTNGCFKQDDGLSLVKLSQIVPPAKPSADTTPNHNSTCSSGTDSTALCLSVDTPTFADNSLDSLGGDQPESSPQRDVTMESPEAYAKSTGNSQPVYAISAFWDEMEKLTINDILQIRMGRCMLPIEETVITDNVETTCTDNASTEIVDSINLPESAFLDTADSDYYSKPDRSSCDFSTSDFEEEYWQFINSSRNTSPDQYDKSYQSECMDYVSTGEESDDMGTPVPSEDYSGQAFCNSTVNSYDLAVPLQIRKNKSMYDIHAPKSMEDLSSQAFWDQSSCKSLKEPLKMTDGFEVVTPIMCVADEQYQISFPEVFEYLFDDNMAKGEAMSVSVYGLQGNYASPMTDYTFCTPTNDLPLMPYNEEPIPIFSCSRPTVRELTFPKPGSIFLGSNYTTMKDVSPIQIVSRSILQTMDCKHTDRSYCFSQDLTSLYSIERICFLDKGSYAWRDQAEDEEKPVDVTDVTVVGEGGVLSVTSKIFKEAALWQISMEKNQMSADYQSIFSTIKQSDMCLVCIAFASWVLRSSDPEAADAWKAALLANVSALSAIQYLRHYMKEKTSPPDE